MMQLLVMIRGSKIILTLFSMFFHIFSRFDCENNQEFIHVSKETFMEKGSYNILFFNLEMKKHTMTAQITHITQIMLKRCCRF